MSIDIARAGDGYTLSPDDRLEALQWALAECESHGDLNDIQHGAPFRALTKFAGPTAERAARLLSARYHQITAAYAARDAARRNPAAESKE